MDGTGDGDGDGKLEWEMGIGNGKVPSVPGDDSIISWAADHHPPMY